MLVAPAKGLRVVARDVVERSPRGVRENRRFFLIDAVGRMVNGKRLNSLQAVVADYSDEQRELSRFADDTVVSGVVEPGARKGTVLLDEITAVEALGPWSGARSTYVGAPLRLVESEGGWGAVDRGPEAEVSLISRATVQRLSRAPGLAQPIDAPPRRRRRRRVASTARCSSGARCASRCTSQTRRAGMSSRWATRSRSAAGDRLDTPRSADTRRAPG